MQKPMTQTIHIIGAGLAGLHAAYHAASSDAHVILYESSPQAGGRCRSYFDEKLQTTLDNGNHIILGVNSCAMELLDTLNLRDEFHRCDIGYDFHGLSDGQRWRLASALRLPFLRLAEIGPLISLLCAHGERTVSEYFSADSRFYQRVIVPLCISALNTQPTHASARLFASVLRKALFTHKANRRIYWPKQHWGQALITPLTRAIEEMGVEIHYNCALKHFECTQDQLTRLHFAEKCITLDTTDKVILALPLAAIHHIMPNLRIPATQEGIINGHFISDLAPKREGEMVGMTDGVADWVFCKPGVISTTTSASSRIATMENSELAATLWAEACGALGMAEHAQIVPPYRIVHEKRASFTATPENLARRPGAATSYSNLFLAGDYTDTGLPATIEGALKSGKDASALACAHGLA